MYTAQTKAIKGHSGPPGRGTKWIAARRGQFVVDGTTIRLNDWEFRADDVADPIVWRLPVFWFWRMSTLEFHSDGVPYQFGFNPWAKVLEHLPFECELREARVAYSPFSIVLRVMLWTALLLWLISELN
ncbi:MAG: hypothetical protein AAGA90_18760 [Actinomycetota bacterium]